MYQIFLRTMLGLDLEQTIDDFETGLKILRHAYASGNVQFWWIKRTSDNVTLAQWMKS